MSFNCVFPMFWFLLIVFEWELDVFDADPLWIQWIFHGFSHGIFPW